MEAELSVGQQRIRFDFDATIALYARAIRVPGADSCGCIYCKNYAAQRPQLFPAGFVSFLKKLGVDPLKEWEAFNYDFDAKTSRKLSLYGGWFLFVGQLLDSLDNPPPLQDGFAYWFTTSFPTGTLPKALKVCAVEFLIELPWVLTETPG